jgi:hypothetical protein
MRASDFSPIIECPACNGTDPSCPFCGDGAFSYYCPANPSEADRDVLIYGVESDVDGRVKKMLPARRVNVLAGDSTKAPPTDENGDITVAPDMADRMQNQLGANAPYEVAGQTITGSDLPNGWPSDPDMTPQEVLAWLEARGSTALANPLREAIANLGL